MTTSEAVFLLLVLATLGYFVWMWVDMQRLMRYPGRHHSIRVWQEPLEEDVALLVRTLSSDVVEPYSWVHIEDGMIRVQSRRQGWFTSWPYIATIDLRRHPSIIQYHTSLPSFLVLIPFVATIIAAPFVLVLLLINHWMERRAIYDFLRRLSMQFESSKATMSASSDIQSTTSKDFHQPP